jgi:hypothetical protein
MTRSPRDPNDTDQAQDDTVSLDDAEQDQDLDGSYATNIQGETENKQHR